MSRNIFELTSDQLKEIAISLEAKIKAGLDKENTEILCIPTYITPNVDNLTGKAVVLDLGGTNYRAAAVEFRGGELLVCPKNGSKKDLQVMKSPGFTQTDLFKEQASLLSDLIQSGATFPVGYCFSYPAESLLDGDAKLLRWTKGVDIKEMINQPVGRSLLDYLNTLGKAKFEKPKVINDTVASLFAGLAQKGYDAYIGLIVGTGTNMAGFIQSDKIGKLNPECNLEGWIPVNLESGNFHPPHLTEVDNRVDALSDNKGAQRFEKAVSGMYLGEVFKAAFPDEKFDKNIDGQALNYMLNHPTENEEKYMAIARAIYERSAELVAASLAGFILVLISHDNSVKRIRLTAEGSLFWSENKNGQNYNDVVLAQLHKLLGELGHADVQVEIGKIENANLIGSAIAALS